jgi:DNA-binding LacI/PurR family transcriptional regulator
MMGKISQKDIAASLSLSRVTVTKALKDHPDIAADTIRKVKDRALELGYIPNLIGRSLSSNRTYTIGIIVPKIASSFFSYSIEKIYKAAHKKGYNIIPMVSFEDHIQEIENIRTLVSLSVDGIILDIAQNTPDNSGYELAINRGCKVVFYDRHPPGFTLSSIVTDDRKGAYELTKHLVGKGYRRIYHFAGPATLSISEERRKGYEAAIKEADLEKHIQSVEMNRVDGSNALHKLAENNTLPDAVFAVNDVVAHGIYDAAAELGLNIPSDLAVAGFGDLKTSALLSPPMTTVNPPLEKMAGAAVEMLINMIEKDEVSTEQRVFESLLVIRRST